MQEDYRIHCVDKPDDPVWEAIGGGIQRHNTEHAGDDYDGLVGARPPPACARRRAPPLNAKNPERSTGPPVLRFYALSKAC